MAFVKRSVVLKALDVHTQTLYNMVKRGDIKSVKTSNNQRRYNLAEYLKRNDMEEVPQRVDVCYCRVSTKKKSRDLEKQVRQMERKYPNHKIIKDIGSGIDMDRKGLKKILALAIERKLGELVIMYKDRLSKFGYEMIEWIIKKYSDGKIRVLKKRDEDTLDEEMTNDLLYVMNSYVTNVKRKHKKILNI